MSVELIDTPRFYGFRVRRQIDGKTYQEYFSLKYDGRRMRGAKRSEVKQQAESRDDELAHTQKTSKDKASREIHIDNQGRVRGILFRMKTEPNLDPVGWSLLRALQDDARYARVFPSRRCHVGRNLPGPHYQGQEDGRSHG